MDALTANKGERNATQNITTKMEGERKEQLSSEANNKIGTNGEKESKKSTFTLPEDIPEHTFFALYGPDFRLPISSGMLIRREEKGRKGREEQKKKEDRSKY